MMIDSAECDAIDCDEGKEVCNMVVDNCDFNEDGAVDGCEFLACLHMHGEEAGCIAECPCGPEDENMYCMILGMCMEMMEEELV
jgi:hypothetical protein